MCIWNAAAMFTGSSSVSVVSRLQDGRVGLIPERSQKGFFCAPPRPDRHWGQLSPLFNGHWGLFHRGVKRPERETDH